MPQGYNTSDGSLTDLSGSMTATGNNINTYNSTNLGVATSVVNRQAPPPVSVVLTFSNGTQYTICGRPGGGGFVGQAQSGNQSCPQRSPRNDDWTADIVLPDTSPKPKTKPGKNPSQKAK